MNKQDCLKRQITEAEIVPEINEEEIWKTYPKNSYYEISSFGRIRNINNYFVSIRLDKDGYPTFFDSKTRKTLKVHRVVCETFHGIPDKQNLCVDHIDNCRQNNYYKNLRWVTASENVRKNSRSRASYINKDNQKIVLLDKHTDELIKEFNSPRDASEELDLSLIQIMANLHGRRCPFRIGYFLTKEQFLDKMLDKA